MSEQSMNIYLEKLNDDEVRVILSFLSLADLCELELVSKQLKICQLTTDDQFWKVYYFKKIDLFLESTNSYTINYNHTTGMNEQIVKYSEIYNQYHNFNNNFKYHFLELIRDSMKKADQYHSDKTAHIKKLSQKGHDIYIPKSEVLKYKLRKEITTVVGAKPLKIVQPGDKGVGKTCLWMTLVSGTFPEEYVPTVVDNYTENAICEDKIFCLDLWDTASRTDFERLRPIAYVSPPTDLFLLSFSCCDNNGLDNVASMWISELRSYCPDAPIILVCNKIDLRSDSNFTSRLIATKQKKLSSFEQGELLAKKMGCATYVETSASRGIGISDLREVMIKVICMWNDPSFQKLHQKKCMIQ